MGKMIERGLPCPKCNSSDAMAKYSDETDGKVYGICFSAACPTDGKAQYFDDWSDMKDDTFEEAPKQPQEASKPAGSLSMYTKALPSVGRPDRKLSITALERYGVRETKTSILFPYFKGDDLIGVKVRGVKEKTFAVAGTVNKQMLFGQQAFKSGGRAITVHAGEYDAIAGYEMFGFKYPNVSLATGDGSAVEACKANFDYLNSFEKIVFSFDADESGQKHLEECCALFGDKARIIKMDKELKDANGYLMAGKAQEWTQAWWNASVWVPDGIVAGNTLWDRMNQPLAKPIIPWPWSVMNEKLHGIYPRRLYTLTAGSGVGKTQTVREIAYWALQQSQENIGLLMLEESVEESCLGFMSIHLSKPLHVPTTKYTQEEYRDAYLATHGHDNNRIYYHDHFGSTGVNNILDRVSYLIRVRGCKFIFLDHLSIIVSAQLQGDERKAIDEIMTKLRMLVQATGATMFLISHLSRRPGKDYTEGAQVSTGDLRGSASIEQLSDCIIACERNGQHTDPKIANTTNLRILKSRQFGRLGLADGLYYDMLTGRMSEVEPVNMEDTTEGETF